MRVLILYLLFVLKTYVFSQSTLIYTQDFSSSVPTGWAVVNAGTGNNWSTTYLSSSLAYNGSYSMRYNRNVSNAANSWVFTQGVSMISGRKYRVEFYQRVDLSSYTERMKVTVGTSQTVASQTTTLLTLSSLNNTTYTNRVTSEFTCSSTGTYHFSFNCYSVANQSSLFVDNVRIYESNISLPIELYEFNGISNISNNHLYWITSSEQNTSHFNLQKSSDGEIWTNIATLDAATNSITQINYNVTDYNVEPIINYYRLQQYDLDGVYDTYGPISINNTNSNQLKTIVKYINLIGQEINPSKLNVLDFYVEVYNDGTIKKVIK